MIYGCIGEHLSHSFSREIHALLGGEPYELIELSAGQLESFFQKRDFCGINVTIPYKTAVLPYLDEIDETARLCGAVNTIVNRDGKLFGYNTDLYGLSALSERVGATIEGKTLLITGTGGTAKTAAAFARIKGAERVLCVSRTVGQGDLTYAELPQIAPEIDGIIQTTPAEMTPNDEASLLDLRLFPRLSFVLDAVYHPLRTNLVLAARERGIPAEGGLFMLVAQAVRSAELFRGMKYDDGQIEKAYLAILRQKENLVLVGMPGCGKSTVGSLVSKRLARPFFDFDAEVERRAGKSIFAIFRDEGADAFRALEAEVVRDFSKMNGAVFATGGGTPFYHDNLRRLARNGRICFLDRPRWELLPTADRPLAQTDAMLDALYSERVEKYRAMADLTIPVLERAEKTAELLENTWRKQ